MVLLSMHLPYLEASPVSTGSSRRSQSKLRHSSPWTKAPGNTVEASQQACLQLSTVTGADGVPTSRWSSLTSMPSFTWYAYSRHGGGDGGGGDGGGGEGGGGEGGGEGGGAGGDSGGAAEMPQNQPSWSAESSNDDPAVASSYSLHVSVSATYPMNRHVSRAQHLCEQASSESTPVVVTVGATLLDLRREQVHIWPASGSAPAAHTVSPCGANGGGLGGGGDGGGVGGGDSTHVRTPLGVMPASVQNCWEQQWSALTPTTSVRPASAAA